VAIELLLVLLLQAEHDLHRDGAKPDITGRRHDDLRRVFEYVRLRLLARYGVLHHSLSVHPHELKDFEDPWVDHFSSVRNDAHDYLLP